MPAAPYWAKEITSELSHRTYMRCINKSDFHTMKKNYTHSLRKDGDITDLFKRESSLKHHVCSNIKHKTKENGPGQTAAI